MTSLPSVESQKRKLPSDDFCEDGEILSDEDNLSKIIKTDSEKQSESHNLFSDNRLEYHEDSKVINENSRIVDIDKNETIDGFVVIEDSEDKTIIVDNLLDKDKNVCCSQATETTDSGIGSQSLDIDENRQQLNETIPINEETLIKSPSPCITIQFKDSLICDQYKVKFLKFLNNFVELEAKFTDNFNIEIYQDCHFDPNEWVVIDETLHETLIIDEDVYCSPPKKHRNKKSKAKKELFVLDSNPSPSTSSSSSHKNGHDLRYTSKFVINSDKKLEEKTSNLKCFNCGEDHLLKDCTQPKDSRRINNAREKCKQNQKPTRYHVEPDERLCQLAPGKFSNELRNALALRRNELPPFIYKMRRFGYPPGWLEEAKIVYSDLDLFDIDGKNLKTNGPKSGGIDLTKIIDYPGFNVPSDKDYRDEYKFYGVPPYSEAFSKESMVKYIDEQLKRANDNLETVDMDLDDGDVTMITVVDDVENCRQIVNNELSLNELEQQKLELLNELNDEEVNEDKSTTNPNDNNNHQQSEQKMINSIVKSTCYGTPILKNNSPFMKLPNPDNFSKDISPVINFENLPNSTGKYEQMVDVLQKVRKTLKDHQQPSCPT